MPEPTPLAPLTQILKRLEAIEQAVHDIEDMQAVVIEGLRRIEGLHRTDHAGLGRGGMEAQP